MSGRAWNPFRRAKADPTDDNTTQEALSQSEADALPVQTLEDRLKAADYPGESTAQSGLSSLPSPNKPEKHKQPCRPNLPGSQENGDEAQSQDILEVWFSGNHGDIGGGWAKHYSETWPLAHQALVWMVQEAQKAGLRFDQNKLVGLNCTASHFDNYGRPDPDHGHRFERALHESSEQSFIHDCLRYGRGLPDNSVAGWRLMEYLVSIQDLIGGSC
jgi:hypothetical protein